MVFKRILFYVLSFTWGALMSTVGLIIIGALACFKRVRIYHGRLYGIVGQNWGGIALGCFFVCCENGQYEQLMAHEGGHGLQNIIWGPLMLFVIGIPSATRSWYRYLRYTRKGKRPPTEYDDIWFEGQATRWGTKYITTDLW